MGKQENFKEYLMAQANAFNEWIWFFGIDTGLNLRDYFTETELWHIWVNRYAQDFRDEYNSEES